MSENLDMEALDLSFREIKTPVKSKSNTPGEYTCSDCDHRYKSKDALRKHMKMHIAAYSCKTCTRAFDSEDKYKEHIEIQHNKVNLCATCGKSFWKKSSLLKHTALHSEDGKPHMCPYSDCDKKFMRKELLADHINKHTGAKPYKCTICRKSYATRSSYSHHVKCCAKNPVCKSCNKNFSSDSVLADHMKSEHGFSWFVCSCGKKYKWRTNLARHRRSCSSV